MRTTTSESLKPLMDWWRQCPRDKLLPICRKHNASRKCYRRCQVTPMIFTGDTKYGDSSEERQVMPGGLSSPILANSTKYHQFVWPFVPSLDLWRQVLNLLSVTRPYQIQVSTPLLLYNISKYSHTSTLTPTNFLPPLLGSLSDSQHPYHSNPLKF